MMISTFEALTLLPPKQETFNCFYVSGGYYRKTKKDLDAISNLATEQHTANLGYRKLAKSMQLGFRLGSYWFPVTRQRADRMFKKYGLKIASPKTDARYQSA